MSRFVIFIGYSLRINDFFLNKWYVIRLSIFIYCLPQVFIDIFFLYVKFQIYMVYALQVWHQDADPPIHDHSMTISDRPLRVLLYDHGRQRMLERVLFHRIFQRVVQLVCRYS